MSDSEASGSSAGLGGDTQTICDALELSVLLLRGIAQKYPEVLRDNDIEAFIAGELNPAQAAARRWLRHVIALERLIDRHAGTPPNKT